MVSALLSILLVAAAPAAPHPTKPRVLGPRRTADHTPTFRLSSSERGLPRASLRFRCELDRRPWHRCARRYTPSLRLGRHLLLVKAVDPKGGTSPATRVVVRVVRRSAGPAPADQTIAVGAQPFNVAFGFGSLWVAVDATLVRLDPASGTVQARIPVGGRPWGVTLAGDGVWVGNYDNSEVARVDPATNAVAKRFVVDGQPVGVAVGGGAVWAANNVDDRIWKLNPLTGAVLAVAHVGDRHEFVGFSEGRVWVASEDGTIGELDAATGVVKRALKVGSDADYLGFSSGSIWVTNYRTSDLTRIDAATGTVAQVFDIGYTGAQAVADDGSSLWVALYNAGLVLKVDRSTGAVRKRFRVGVKPRGLTVAAGSVWVANSSSGTLSRIALSR